ncbi:hypothetical protein BDZ97DRAFT_510017 [Flammula alnicola]|nr:hypothetical protein BDZ97DRAFT_510017 [Flammula alnicola]
MGARAIRSDSDSPIEEEDEEEEDDDDDDGILEMRSSSSTYRTHSSTSTLKPKPKKPPRSQSKVSTASSSSSTSTSTTTSNSSASHSTTGTSSPSSSLSPSRRTGSSSNLLHHKTSSSSMSTSASNATATATSNSGDNDHTAQRRLSHSNYRPSGYRRGPPPLIRTPSEHVHVTIAPIAPTILKTGGAWAEGFGDEGASDDGFGFGAGWPWAAAAGGGGVGGALGSGNEKRGKSGLRSPVPGGHGHGHGQDGYGSAGYGSSGGGSGNGYGPFGTGRAGGGRGFHIATGMGLGLGGDDERGEDAQGSDGTPVELVYVPPFGSNYSMGWASPRSSTMRMAVRRAVWLRESIEVIGAGIMGMERRMTMSRRIRRWRRAEGRRRRRRRRSKTPVRLCITTLRRHYHRSPLQLRLYPSPAHRASPAPTPYRPSSLTRVTHVIDVRPGLVVVVLEQEQPDADCEPSDSADAPPAAAVKAAPGCGRGRRV